MFEDCAEPKIIGDRYGADENCSHSLDSSSVHHLRINEKRYWRQCGQCRFGEI